MHVYQYETRDQYSYITTNQSYFSLLDSPSYSPIAYNFERTLKMRHFIGLIVEILNTLALKSIKYLQETKPSQNASDASSLLKVHIRSRKPL
jgi:hypothetical protein